MAEANRVGTVNVHGPVVTGEQFLGTGSALTEFGPVGLFWETREQLTDAIAALTSLLGRWDERERQASMEPLPECEGSELPARAVPLRTVLAEGTLRVLGGQAVDTFESLASTHGDDDGGRAA